MYLRFITEFTNEWDERQTGVFQALGSVLRGEELFDHDHVRLKELHTWFNNNLDRPNRFNKHSNKNKRNIAISWFKDTANEHLEKMYQLKSLLETYGMIVEVIRADNPGYKVFEDEFQIVTIPHGKQKAKVL